MASRQQTIVVLSTILSLGLIYSEASKIGFEKRRAKLINISEGLLHVVRIKQQCHKIILLKNQENRGSNLDHVGREFQLSISGLLLCQSDFIQSRPCVNFSR